MGELSLVSWSLGGVGSPEQHKVDVSLFNIALLVVFAKAGRREKK